jgi:GGDEF domain-containing protein
MSAGQSYRDVLRALAAAVQRPNASLALLLLNLVGVSKLQARLGFETCGLLLQALSDGLIAALRGRGLVIRLGDGSFCVIVNAIRNSGHAVLAGEKLARAVDDAMTAAAVAVKPQLNIGISLFPSQAADPNNCFGWLSLQRPQPIIEQRGFCSSMNRVRARYWHHGS